MDGVCVFGLVCLASDQTPSDQTPSDQTNTLRPNMMTERAYTSMRAIHREVDFILLAGTASILALYIFETVALYVLRTFRRVSPNTCHTANSESVKP